MPPGGVAQSCLCLGESHASQSVDRRNPGAACNLAGQQFRLVEAPLPLLAPMQGYGSYRVIGFVAGQGGGQQIGQGADERADPGILIKMNQFAEGTLIGSETISGVKPAQTGPAERATPLGVQRIPILKRCPATGTVELRRQGFGFPETSGADRNARDYVEGLSTKPAFVGKKQEKKRAEG